MGKYIFIQLKTFIVCLQCSQFPILGIGLVAGGKQDGKVPALCFYSNKERRESGKQGGKQDIFLWMVAWIPQRIFVNNNTVLGCSVESRTRPFTLLPRGQTSVRGWAEHLRILIVFFLHILSLKCSWGLEEAAIVSGVPLGSLQHRWHSYLVICFFERDLDLDSFSERNQCAEQYGTWSSEIHTSFSQISKPSYWTWLAQVQRGNVLGLWGVHASSRVHVCWTEVWKYLEMRPLGYIVSSFFSFWVLTGWSRWPKAKL